MQEESFYLNWPLPIEKSQFRKKKANEKQLCFRLFSFAFQLFALIGPLG